MACIWHVDGMHCARSAGMLLAGLWWCGLVMSSSSNEVTTAASTVVPGVLSVQNQDVEEVERHTNVDMAAVAAQGKCIVWMIVFLNLEIGFFACYPLHPPSNLHIYIYIYLCNYVPSLILLYVMLC